MILCLDAGNTQIHGGVFQDDYLLLQFRKNTKKDTSSDELGLFLRAVLKENDLNPDEIQQISLCTVVPEILHSLNNACLKYFKRRPFILQAGAKTGLKINYRNPSEVGADRIANAIAATHLHENQNMIVVDFGTATTFCAIKESNEYCGGIIIPGLKISMQSLESNTSKLPAVEIKRPQGILGRSTVESIQSGLYYSTLGSLREITSQLQAEVFDDQRPVIIGTGGFSSLFSDSKIFDDIVPDLVLKGLYLSLKMNS